MEIRKEHWDVNGEPLYRLSGVMETYCSENSRHRLEDVIVTKVDNAGKMKEFDVLYQITEEPMNDGYRVETRKKSEAYDLRNQMMAAGYKVVLVPLDNENMAVVSVRQLPEIRKEYGRSR